MSGGRDADWPPRPRANPAVRAAVGLPRWRRWLRALFAAGVVSMLIWPPVRAGCADPVHAEPGPDGREVLAVCDRPPTFASPRAAVDAEGDARGWITLRDGRGYLSGVVDLSSMDGLRWAPEWRDGAVRLPGFAEFRRHETQFLPIAWLRDRGWKWRALLGFVAPDAAFR